MTNNPGTIPTPIVNSLGIATTVHRKPKTTSSGGRRAFPSPKMGALTTVTSHESRVKDIAARNAAWVSGKRPSTEVRNAVGVKALNIMDSLMRTAISSDDHSASLDFIQKVNSYIKTGDYEMVMTADSFAAASYIISEAEDDVALAAKHPIDFNNPDVTGWKADYVGVYDFDSVTTVVSRLREYNLLAYDEVPSKTDRRFVAHLYMSATRTLQYHSSGDRDIIALVDEFPERTLEIREMANQGLYASGIRSQINGEVTRSLADGVL